METEHNLTDFNNRVRRLQAVMGKSQSEIAGLLAVSRTTLHYYCVGQSSPKAAAWYRLEQAERQAGISGEGMPGVVAAPKAGEESAMVVSPEETPSRVDGWPRSEVALERHLRWLRAARQRQDGAARAAAAHLREIDDWILETEAELQEVRNVGEGHEFPEAAAGEERRPLLRDIDTVSLPIFGALPAGWPQTREGVLQRQPHKTRRVRRGQFPEGVFGLEVRGDSMNAARPVPVFDGDVVVLLSPEQREPRHNDIVAALIDGETCLKRLKTKRRKRRTGAFLKSESTNPAHGEIHPAHELVIQGVLVGKL